MTRDWIAYIHIYKPMFYHWVTWTNKLRKDELEILRYNSKVPSNSKCWLFQQLNFVEWSKRCWFYTICECCINVESERFSKCSITTLNLRLYFSKKIQSWVFEGFIPTVKHRFYQHQYPLGWILANKGFNLTLPLK